MRPARLGEEAINIEAVVGWQSVSQERVVQKNDQSRYAETVGIIYGRRLPRRYPAKIFRGHYIAEAQKRAHDLHNRIQVAISIAHRL